LGCREGERRAQPILLKAVDIEAERRGTTRSGLLREWAEEALRRRTNYRVERLAQIEVLDGSITGHGGGVGRPAVINVTSCRGDLHHYLATCRPHRLIPEHGPVRL
jgi:hypothetical protein